MNTDHIADGPQGPHGAAEILSGAAPMESEELGDKMEKLLVIEEGDMAADDFPLPTEEEQLVLRKVPGRIPRISYILCIVELAERASYYGAQQIFSNYMQFPLPDGGDGTGAVPENNRDNGHAGALGKGLQFASAFSILFTFFAYVFPILGAWIADVKLGRFKTIMLGVVIGGFAHIIMIAGAAPTVLKAGNGLAPFMISLFLLAIGAGIFKPNVAPTVLDQYTQQKQYVQTTKSGERVIVDPERTIQTVMLWFYMCINIGGFFGIATTYTEKYIGYWVAFLEPGIIYFVLPIMLMAIYKKLILKPAKGSELTDFVKICWTAAKTNKFNFFAKDFWAKSKPSVLARRGVSVGWSDQMVDDVQRTLAACVVFLYFPIYNINDGGIGATMSNQGAGMTQNGAPNDLISNFNPLIIIICTPILAWGLYPLLARFHIKFGPIRRMTVGFVMAAVSGVIGAILQWKVYETSPCGYGASDCDGVSPISIWWQLPVVLLGALSELFCNVTAYEMAYARSPPHLKACVMAIFLFTNALSQAIAEVMIPAINDPFLIWVWAGPAIALFVQTAIFWIRHRKMDDEVYMLDREAPASQVAIAHHDEETHAHHDEETHEPGKQE